MRRFVLMAAALLVVAVLGVVLRPAPSEPARQPPVTGTQVGKPDLQGRRGALVDQIVFTRETDIGRVVGLIEAGTHQAFTQGISSTTVFHRVRDSLATHYDFAFGTSSELTLNPAGPEFANGELNPFYVPAIREALNRLVNRRHIAEEIFGGLAVPRFLPLTTAFPDYARLADVARALELRYAHDPQAARAAIHREMEALGARYTAGRWTYRNAPVRLIVLIRTEDARRRVGDYVANLMEDLGFAVERRYRTAEEASRLWIASDPRAGHWHLYTGGWIATVIQRDQAQNFSDYYTPRGRAEPLWQAYRPAPEFDALAERLQRRDYRSWGERQAMMGRALELSLQDSVRVWLVDQLNVSPRAANVEVAIDLAGGLSGSALWPYTVRYTDRVGGHMVFGTPGLLTEPWNPVAGSNWIFDQMLIRAIDDTVVLPDPFTGLFWPQRITRAEVTVQQDVPVGRTLDWLSLDTAADIAVPADAWIGWDAAAGRFVTVGERFPDGVGARTRVRVEYQEDLFEHRWHDGTRHSLADFVLPWILTFERAGDASPLFDVAYLPTFEAFQRHFRGWRIVSRAPLVIEIYSDQIFPDAESIVAARAPGPAPWHTLFLGILAERGGELAFSANKADRLQVGWMSLVAGPSLAVLARHLRDASERELVPYPTALEDFLGDGEVAGRYRALAEWYRQRGHFWVGNGPFQLHSVHPIEGSVVLRRFPDFPDAADKWLRFARPEVPELDLDGPMVVQAGEAAEFRVLVTFEGRPYAREAIDAVQYLLFDGRGELAARGEAVALADGLWRVALAPETLAALGVGANSLEIAVTSRRVALPAFASHVFATVPGSGRGAER